MSPGTETRPGTTTPFFRQLSAMAHPQAFRLSPVFQPDLLIQYPAMTRAEGAQQAAAAGTHREHRFPSGRG